MAVRGRGYYFDLRDSPGCLRNPTHLHYATECIILDHGAVSLKYLNHDGRLVVSKCGECLVMVRLRISEDKGKNLSRGREKGRGGGKKGRREEWKNGRREEGKKGRREEGKKGRREEGKGRAHYILVSSCKGGVCCVG